MAYVKCKFNCLMPTMPIVSLKNYPQDDIIITISTVVPGIKFSGYGLIPSASQYKHCSSTDKFLQRTLLAGGGKVSTGGT